ncbi:hypothetical protein GW796_06260 [archaeon]|nr:hypothetical protein [archaeon]
MSINLLLVFLFFFLTQMTFIEFKKSKLIKEYKDIVVGIITGITPKENGIFFEITYPDGDEKKIYEHLFLKRKIKDEKMQILAEHYLTSPFYLSVKKINNIIIQVIPYSNAKLFKWLYLLGALVSGAILLVRIN